MADSYAQLIGESLTSIAAEAPACYAAASTLARDLSFNVTIDGEVVGLVADPLLRLAEPGNDSRVWADTTSAAISAILDGTTTIETLVLNDSLYVRGTVDDIARGHDVLLSYIHGAIRSPSVPKLRARFDTHTRGR